MNCAECRENLVAWAEGLLEHDEKALCETHLESCADCRSESAAILSLQRQLVARGQDAAQVAIVEPVLRRVQRESKQPEGNIIMRTLLKYRWGFGLGAAATAALVIFASLLGTSKIQAAAVEVMTKGAQAAAKLTSIHLRGQLRTAPADNFSAIMPNQDFVPVELWEQFEPTLQWRVDKPGRTAVMDGKSTMLFIKPDYATRFPRPSSSAFDTEWLHEMANLNRTLRNELSAIKAHGWQVTLTQKQGTDGKAKSVITVEAKTGFASGDYLKNRFFRTADTRRVYVFDNETERLEGVQIYLHTDSGETPIFTLDQIEYNQPIDAAVFELQLPASVTWAQQMKMLPDNAKYASMTPEEAARAFFEACGRQDWDEAGKFCTMTGSLKEGLGGLEVVSIGKSFTSLITLVNGAHFVPYELKLKSGRVKKWNLALKRDGTTQRWFVDGGI